MSKISKTTERKEYFLNVLKSIFILLVIMFLIPYFLSHNLMIILFLLEGKFNFATAMDLYYIIHTIILSIISFTLFILFLTKVVKKKEV